MIIIEDMSYISISVSNIDESVQFYKDMFEFDVIEKQSGMNEAILQLGGIKLRLSQIEDFAENSRKEDYICFTVDPEEFDDILEEVEEKNINIIFGPENIANGRKVIIGDPDNNKIALSYI